MKRLVFLLLVVLCAPVKSDSQGQHDTHDNEFAEFEDFDENDDVPVEPIDEEDTDFEEQSPNEVEEEEDEDAVVETEDDEFDTLDPDEFEGLPGDDTIWDDGKSSKKQKKPEPRLEIANVPLHLRSWDKYYMEIIMVAGLAVYLLNFFIGKSRNSSIASAWLRHNLDFLQTQFEIVGDDPQNATMESTDQLNKDAEHSYSLWCSGRLCCEGMLVELKLLKRQDLISVISQRFKPSNDKVTITITLQEMDPFVLCVGAKKSVTNLQKFYQDVGMFCVDKQRTAEKFNLPADYCILAELYGEVPNAILDSKVVKVLSENLDIFDSLHISDQFSGLKPTDQDEQPAKIPETEKVIILSLTVPKSTDPTAHLAGMLPMLKMAVYLIDKVRRYRLSKENKFRADKHRQEVTSRYLKQTHAQRQEAAQLKKEEKAKALKEKMMNEEDPEKQRKLDEQIKRREANKKSKKMMKGRQFKVKAM